MAYQIDGLEQDELYTMHIQEFRPGTGVIQLSDEFFLCKYMQFSYAVVLVKLAKSRGSPNDKKGLPVT